MNQREQRSDLRIKLIGVGGVGGICARYLTLFLSHLELPSRVVLIDGDRFEDSNATRMAFSRLGNKAEVVAEDLQPLLDESGVSLQSIPEFVAPDNLERLLRSGDIVLLAVDNHATRKLVSEHCCALDDVCLISGGNDGVEENAEGRPQDGTFGNVQLYLRTAGENRSPSLTRFHPEIEHPADRSPTEVGCDEQIHSVPQLLFTNLMTATVMLNMLRAHLDGKAGWAELVFDLGKGLMRPVVIQEPAEQRKK